MIALIFGVLIAPLVVGLYILAARNELTAQTLVITLLIILGLVLGCWAFLIALDMNVGGFIEKQPQTVPTWLEEQ